MTFLAMWWYRERPVLRILALASWVLGCGSGEPRERAASLSPPEPAALSRPRIIVLGDSLTSGYGLRSDEAYPALLQARLESEGYDFEVVNAGVSGDTTAGGLRRLDWALEGDVRILILALGANDGLRGLPVLEMKSRLSTMIERARDRGVTVLLAGMEAPPNQGEAYTKEFREAFRDLAREKGVIFMPFLLEGVAGFENLNQADGIHPDRDGARIIAENLWGYLEPVLERPGVR